MDINTTNKKLTVWVAKFPQYIAERILSADGEMLIGTLSINKEANSVKVRINLSDALLSDGIPTDYIIDIKDKDKPIFVVRNDDSQMVVEGCVNKECFVRPVMNVQYMEFKRRQAMASEEKSSVRMIDYFYEIRKGEKYGSLREMDALSRKRKLMLQEKKRERLDSQDVLDMIFSAFEQRDLWTVKDLADFTGQPIAYIQELVSEIGVLNKRDHKNSYELKPEYKQSR